MPRLNTIVSLPPAKPTCDTGKAPPPAIEPEQVSAGKAARLAGVSEATWWRLHAAGKVPRPNKLGCRTLWRIRELRDWIAAGCPDRRTWEARQAAQANGRP
jgi:predicted DNA-binding transcriptional regulator AlpA